MSKLEEPRFFQIQLHRPDTKEKLSFFISGLIISVPLTVFLEVLAEDYLSIILPRVYASFFLAIFFAPIIEEYSKIFPLFHRHAETERSIVTLGFLVGLGFGISEFFVYVLGRGVPVLIRIPGVLFHAASTSITSYGIAKEKIIRYFLIAISLHFLNNLSAELGFIWLIGGLATVTVTCLFAWRLYNDTTDNIV